MPVHDRSRQPFTGESGAEGGAAGFVARGTSASFPREGASHHVIQNAKGIAVPVAMRGSELAVVSSYVVRQSRLQKSTGDHCWSHRSLFTGPTDRVDREIDGR
jgi:hypothetical protein